MHPVLTVQAVLHPRQRKDGTHLVQIRLTADRKSSFMDAGFTLVAKHWNEKGSYGEPKWVRKGEKESEALNTHLWTLLCRAKDISDAYPIYTAAQVREQLLLPSDELTEDLRRKAKQNNLNRKALSTSPIVVRHYKKLLMNVELMRRELEAVKADLKKLSTKQSN